MRALLLALLLLAPLAGAAGTCVGPACWSETGTERTSCRNASESASGSTRAYAANAFLVEGQHRCENGTTHQSVLVATPVARATWTSFDGASSVREVEASAPFVSFDWECYSSGAGCGVVARYFNNEASRATPTGPPAPPALPWGHLLP